MEDRILFWIIDLGKTCTCRYGFLRCHPNLTMRSPEQLQVSRASTCSKQRLYKWYKDFDDFLKEHDVKNPQQIWNADESGFMAL